MDVQKLNKSNTLDQWQLPYELLKKGALSTAITQIAPPIKMPVKSGHICVELKTVEVYYTSLLSLK